MTMMWRMTARGSARDVSVLAIVKEVSWRAAYLKSSVIGLVIRRVRRLLGDLLLLDIPISLGAFGRSGFFGGILLALGRGVVDWRVQLGLGGRLGAWLLGGSFWGPSGSGRDIVCVHGCRVELSFQIGEADSGRIGRSVAGHLRKFVVVELKDSGEHMFIERNVTHR